MKTSSGLHRKFSFSIALFTILSVVYIVFYSPFFLVTKESIVIAGNELIEKEDIRSKIFQLYEKRNLLLMKKSNLFLVSKYEIENTILSNFPKIKETVIEKKYPRALRINVEEKKVAFIWMASDRSFFVDTEGMVTNEVFSSDISDTYTKIYDNSGKVPDIRDYVVNEKFIRFAEKVQVEVPKATGKNIAFLKTPSKLANEIDVELLDGYSLLFSTERTYAGQEKVLKLVLARELKDKLDTISYIDLRMQGYVYYKEKDEIE